MDFETVDRPRLYLFAGHYGSGKSEVAVNFAIKLARSHRTAIVDFDIINTFFRSASARATLEQKGIRVIAPIYANTNVDVPALPAEISSLFDDKDIKAVFDVGGDSAGARAVSRYRGEFSDEPVENYFVFNIRRPMTSTVDNLADYFYEIQESARLPFTALVNNTNLLSGTGGVDLLEGLEAATELSGRLSLPVAFSAYMDPAPGCDAGAGAGECEELASFFARSEALNIPVFHMHKYIFMV